MRYVDPNDRLDAGRAALTTVCRRFFRQRGMTQPKWIRLASAMFPGPQHLHSSQIGGLSTGKLKDPTPKCLLVIGELNLALAATVGIGAVDAPRFPEDLRRFWEGLEPMCDPTGRPLGPLDLFRVITGDLDLGLDTSHVIPLDAEPSASAALGRHLRLGLAALGRDFLTELPALRAECPVIEPLLMGKPVPGDSLVAALPELAAIARTTPTDLWAVVADALASRP